MNNYITKLSKAFSTYKQNINYIENALKYDINNGVIEKANNLINVLKELRLDIKNITILYLEHFLLKA